MPLKKKYNVSVEFSMASMTDMIFLLLIFFMLTSTFATTNSIKVHLPESSNQAPVKPLSRVTITSDLRYFVADGTQQDKQVSFEEIAPFLKKSYIQEPDTYVALYADEAIPYKEVVKVLDIANQGNFKMILVTRSK